MARLPVRIPLFFALLASGSAAADECPKVDGTFERAESYGTSALSVHTRRRGKATQISRDGKHFYPADRSKHLEKDEQLGDSEVSFECRKGTIVIHQNLVKLGLLIPSGKVLPPGGVPGTITVKPAGKRAVLVEVSGENPVLKLITGGKFSRKK